MPTKRNHKELAPSPKFTTGHSKVKKKNRTMEENLLLLLKIGGNSCLFSALCTYVHWGRSECPLSPLHSPLFPVFVSFTRLSRPQEGNGQREEVHLACLVCIFHAMYFSYLALSVPRPTTYTCPYLKGEKRIVSAHAKNRPTHTQIHTPKFY